MRVVDMIGFLLALPFALLVGLGCGAAPTLVLLKRKYVLFAVGLLLVLVGAPAVGTGATTAAAPVAVGLVVWAVAASRLSWPGSLWARWVYGPEKAAAARQRAPASSAPVDDGVPASPLPVRVEVSPGPVGTGVGVPPWADRRPLGVALALVAAGLALTTFFFGYLLLMPLAGVLLPFARLLYAGWARARTVLAVGSGAVTALAAVLAVSRGAFTLATGVGLLGVLLLAAGVAGLYRGPGAAASRG